MVDSKIEEVSNSIDRSGIDLILQLPCDRIAPLLEVLNKRFNDITLTREEDGVGIAAGVSLAGAKPIMVVQSSGLGNMVNAIMSLTKFYKLPLPIIISQRGIYKENVAAQVPMGSNLTAILDAMGVEHQTYQESNDLENFSSELNRTFQENKVKCFLFTPKICEGLPRTPIPTPGSLDLSTPVLNTDLEQSKHNEADILEITDVVVLKNKNNMRTRYDALVCLKDFLKNKAVICNMGYPSRELYSIMDQDSNFYMLGSLGLVSSIGLGVSLFTKKEVVVVDGDGSLLMNPNALITISLLQPKNLTVLCLDNGAYGSTGNQPTASAYGLELNEVAKAVGFKQILTTDDPGSVTSFSDKGTDLGSTFVRLMIKPGNAKVGTIELSELEIRDRFINWLRT